MKKLIFSLCLFLLLITGCSNYSEGKIVSDLSKKVNKLSSYRLNGELSVTNNDSVYNYTVDVSYKREDLYKVVLTNVSNNHTQIILKNKSGVYILTPTLNKSFKFQSEWPYNNSQIYLLESIINDIKNDKNRKFEKRESEYFIMSKVNYPNNNTLVKQKAVFDKKLNIKSVKVFDKSNVVAMEMVFKKLDYSPKFNSDYFDVNEIMSTIEYEETKDTMQLNESIYPLFLPENTKLNKEEHISGDNGDRIIMSFSGDMPFTLVEEASNTMDDFTVIPTMGEPYRLMDTLGVMNDNSLSWSTGGIDYYLVSDVMSGNELVSIAQSISVVPTMK